MTEYYLKSTIKVEPFIWSWYAWPYLIPPISAACNIVERHLKIMDSYIQNPQIHAKAVKDPKMLGGPFMDLDGRYIDEIKELINYTKYKCSKLIKLNNAIKGCDRLLQTQAKGNSMDIIYSMVPDEIKGLVELVYDLNNHPSIRVIEPLIYKFYYDDSCQQLALSDTDTDYRKFVLSTPRIDNINQIFLNVPFSDKKLDLIFKSKYYPCKIDQMINTLQITQKKEQLFRSFFSSVPPVNNLDKNYLGSGVRIRYFGHACVLIQTDNTSVLIDPVISYPINSNLPRYTFNDLPDKIDYVIITHNHQDHLMFETLLHLRYKIKHIIFPSNQKGFIADPSIKLILKQIGFLSLLEMSEFDVIELTDGEIVGLPFLGEHSDLNIQSKLSYYLNIKGTKILFAADSNNLEKLLYCHINKLIGNIDILFLGMECDGAPLSWLYGPLLTNPISREFDRNRKLSGSNYIKALSLVKDLRCKQMYVYAMGQEPWLNHVMALVYSSDSIQITESNKLIEKCKSEGIIAERLFGKKQWVIA